MAVPCSQPSMGMCSIFRPCCIQLFILLNLFFIQFSWLILYWWIVNFSLAYCLFHFGDFSCWSFRNSLLFSLLIFHFMYVSRSIDYGVLLLSWSVNPSKSFMVFWKVYWYSCCLNTGDLYVFFWKSGMSVIMSKWWLGW